MDDFTCGGVHSGAAGADYCNFVQYLVNWSLVQEQKKTRGKPRVLINADDKKRRKKR
jgi:hypothetical protein